MLSRFLVFSAVFSTFFIIFNLFVDGTLFVPSLLASLLALLLFRHSIGDVIHKKIWILTLIILMLISLFLTSINDNFEVERIKGSAQLLMSMMLALVILNTMLRQPRKKRLKFYKYGIYLLLGLSTLELTLPFVFDALETIRQTMYQNEYVYSALARDESAYYFLRPKILNQEPSYLGYGLGVFLALYTLSGATSRGYLHLILLIVFSTLLIRSPGLLAIALTGLFFAELKTNRVRAIRGGIAGTLILFTLLAVWASLSARLGNISAGLDFSAFGRLAAPPLVAFDYLTTQLNLFFGSGIAAKEVFYDSIVHVLTVNGFENRVRWMSDATIINLVANFFWLHWLYWGLLGGLLAIFLACKIYSPRSQKKSYRLNFSQIIPPLCLFIVAGHFLGSYVTLRVWVTFALFMLEYNYIEFASMARRQNRNITRSL